MRIPDLFVPGKKNSGTKQVAITGIGAGLFLLVSDIAALLDGPLEGRHFVAEILRSEGFVTILGGFALFFIRRAMGAQDEKPETPEERDARIEKQMREIHDYMQRKGT